MTLGVLPDHEIHALCDSGGIMADTPFDADQVQPASLDLRLGAVAYRLRASFLPGPDRTVKQRLDDGLCMHTLDLRDGAVLERGCVYLVPLQERLNLPSTVAARANPKSSTGRVDVFTRLIVDGSSGFDEVKTGYNGPLYVEIAPQTFSILVKSGCRLNQLRLRRGAPQILRSECVNVDLSGPIAGYRARRHAGVVDMTREEAHAPADFWEEVSAPKGELVLDPAEFYILVSKESLTIPSHEAAEMTPIDPAVGEFRVHYAGFFDPGFGTLEAGGIGSRGVLEVRSRETPFLLTDGQIVARLVYEPLTARPTHLYGELGSHYQKQGLRLSKYFRDPS
jgi:dCTP deaminase